jgi:hypothetical protein
VQRDTFFDMLCAFCLIVFRAFGREFVAANRAFVFLGDLASRTWRLLGWQSGRGHCCECRSWEHVDYGLRSRTEIEGKRAIVGRSVARNRCVMLRGAKVRCLCMTGRQRRQPALATCGTAMVADPPVIARRVVWALRLSMADSPGSILHI